MATTESYGSARVVVRHARELIAGGTQVTIAYEKDADRAGRPEASVLAELAALGANVQPVAGVASLRCLMPFSASKRTLAAAGADVIVSTQVRDAAPAAVLARRLGVSFVALVQNHPKFSGGPLIHALKRAVYRRALRSAERIVSVADHVATVVERDLGIDPSRVGVVPNLIEIGPPPSADRESLAETRRSLNVAEDAFLIVNVGRFHRQKGQVVLVEALSKVEHDNVVVVFVGDVERSASTDYLSQIRHEVSEASLEDHVRFAGFLDDVSAVLEAADLFVSSSLWEAGPSLAVLEAMAAECTVLATDHGDRIDDFTDTVHGLYVPAGDPQALARGLSWMLARSKDERQTMGRNARRLAQERQEALRSDGGIRRQLERALGHPG